MTDLKPAARISPDRRIVAVLAIALSAIIMLASYVFSFSAITAAAEWTGAPSWAQWLAAVFIDGAIVTYTLSLAILRWRQEPVGRTMLFLGSFTGISVAVNFAHAGAAQHWDFSRLETWFAALIGVSAPIAALFAADETTRLVFTRAPQAGPEAPQEQDEPTQPEASPEHLAQLAAPHTPSEPIPSQPAGWITPTYREVA